MGLEISITDASYSLTTDARSANNTKQGNCGGSTSSVP